MVKVEKGESILPKTSPQRVVHLLEMVAVKVELENVVVQLVVVVVAVVLVDIVVMVEQSVHQHGVLPLVVAGLLAAEEALAIELALVVA